MTREEFKFWSSKQLALARDNLFYYVVACSPSAFLEANLLELYRISLATTKVVVCGLYIDESRLIIVTYSLVFHSNQIDGPL